MESSNLVYISRGESVNSVSLSPVQRLTAQSDPRQRVVRQLVEALLFEGLVEYTVTPLHAAKEIRDSAGLPAADNDPIFDSCIEFRIGAKCYRCVATVGAFGRFRVDEGSIARRDGSRLVETNLLELASGLPMSDVAKQRLLVELTQTAELCRWNFENLEHQHEPRRHKSFQDLESTIVEGHLYHPSFKSRTGFTLEDHRTYGPEVGNRFQLQWLAIARSRVRAALPCEDVTFWQHELGLATHSELTARLESHGGSWRDYSLVPIHPWQLGALRDQMRAAVGRREIIELGSAGFDYHASQSLRTLVNASDPTRPNVKLPLDVVCTSTHRNLRPAFICTAPALSEWLVSVVENDPFFQKNPRILMLREYAGISYEPDPADTAWASAAASGQTLIGTVVRESIERKLGAHEAAVPFSALMLIESDGRPFIAEWLDHHGTEAWVSQLISVMLIPIWHMLTHHGIAFESHAQNLILVHVQGWPHKIALRDFHEDTEYVPDYLARPELVPDFARIEPRFAHMPDDDGYRMASTDALRELFMDTVYVYNLAELSFVLARFCAMPEERFWELVRAELQRYKESGVTARARIDRLCCDATPITVESLLKKKFMNGDVLDFFEHTVPNPLANHC